MGNAWKPQRPVLETHFRDPAILPARPDIWLGL